LQALIHMVAGRVCSLAQPDAREGVQRHAYIWLQALSGMVTGSVTYGYSEGVQRRASDVARGDARRAGDEDLGLQGVARGVAGGGT